MQTPCFIFCFSPKYRDVHNVPVEFESDRVLYFVYGAGNLMLANAIRLGYLPAWSEAGAGSRWFEMQVSVAGGGRAGGGGVCAGQWVGGSAALRKSCLCALARRVTWFACACALPQNDAPMSRLAAWGAAYCSQESIPEAPSPFHPHFFLRQWMRHKASAFLCASLATLARKAPRVSPSDVGVGACHAPWQRRH